MAARPTDAAEAADLEVHIIPMRRRHLRAVLRIEGQVYPRPWTLGLFVSELNLKTSRAYYVARVGTSVVGYSGLMLSLEDAHVTNIAVDPAWHRHKVGQRLLCNLAREARRRGAQNLTLEVRVSNESAQAMYRKFGLAPAGVRKGYYVETNEDALIMWADGIDSAEYAARLDRLEADVPGRTVVEVIE